MGFTFWGVLAGFGVFITFCTAVLGIIMSWDKFCEGWRDRDNTVWEGITLFVCGILMIISLTRLIFAWPPDYKEPVQPTPQIIIVTATPADKH